MTIDRYRPRRAHVRLAVSGILAVVLSTLCAPCIAALGADRPAPAQDSGSCHTSFPSDQDSSDCGCPVIAASKDTSVEQAIAPLRTGLDSPFPLREYPATAPGRFLLAGALRPRNKESIPRLSPVKSFGIRLE